MNQEIKTVVKKTAKIAGVTCIAAGAVALMTSAAAIKAMTEGAKYLKDTVKKIIDEEPKSEAAAEEAPAAEVVTEVTEEAPAAEVVTEVAEEAPAAEVVAEEADFAEPDAQEA